MFGWCGKLTYINLSDKSYIFKTPDLNLLKKFIGGRGLAGHFLKKHITRNWNDPDMPLLFFTGPLVNTRSPVSGRMTVMSRSPLTNAICDSSAGGSFGTSLKKAGTDGIIITGRSDYPCGIEIINNQVNFADASHLAGHRIGSVSQSLYKKGSTAIIGPAAENGVRFSSIMIDRHFAAGRGGLGLVMAAKNIKYITVKGTGKTKVFDPKALEKAKQDVFRLAAASPVLLGKFGISRFGTGALYDLMDARRMMPTDNFRKTRFESAPSMNACALKTKYHPQSDGCRGCHILCKKKTVDGIRLPEFETMSHFSALLENSDLKSVTKANQICNEMGMDTISAAATLACYSEIEGEKLSPEKIISLLYDIANNKEMGKKLARGSASYAKLKKAPDTAITVKCQELPAYDPRGAYGMALAYAISSRGGCHLRAYPISHEILRKPVPTDRFSFTGKAGMIKIGEDLNAVADSLTACKFIFFAASLEEYAAIFTSVTGVETSAQDLFEVGERINYNERIMNAANGFTAKDDDLPMRFFSSAGYMSSNIKIKPINREDFLDARANYYTARKLDKKGMPVPSVARNLGLEMIF